MTIFTRRAPVPPEPSPTIFTDTDQLDPLDDQPFRRLPPPTPTADSGELQQYASGETRVARRISKEVLQACKTMKEEKE